MPDSAPPQPPAQSPLVSAVILTYNKAEYTRLCIEGLVRTAYRPLEIVLVDNGSTVPIETLLEESRELTEAAGVKMTVLRNAENKGAPAGRNDGIRAAAGERLLFIDNDAIPFNSHWLDRLAAGLDQLPEAGVVSARLIYPFSPHLTQFAGCGISQTGRVQYIGRGAERSNPRFLQDREAQCLISACILAPSELVKSAGGFDEAFSPVQYEDLDLCYKIRELGRKCYVIGQAEVYHFENTTTDGSSDINFRYVTIRNGMLFKQRWKHRFSMENGPPDADTQWLKLEQRTLAQMEPGWSPWTDAALGGAWE